MRRIPRLESATRVMRGAVDAVKKAVAVPEDMDPSRRAVTAALVGFGLSPELAIPAAGNILQAAVAATEGLPPAQAAAAAIELALGKVQKAVKLYKLFHTNEIYGPRVDMFYDAFESRKGFEDGKSYLQFIIDRAGKGPDDSDALWTLADMDFAKLPAEITVADLCDPIIMQTVLRKEFGVGENKEVWVPSRESLALRADHIKTVLGLSDNSPLSAAQDALKRKKMDVFRSLVGSRSPSDFKGNSLQYLGRLFQHDLANQEDVASLEKVLSEQNHRAQQTIRESAIQDAEDAQRRTEAHERRRLESLESERTIRCSVAEHASPFVLYEANEGPGLHSYLLTIEDPTAARRLQSGRLTRAHIVALRDELARSSGTDNTVHDSLIDVDGQEGYMLVSTDDVYLNEALSKAVERKEKIRVPRLPMDYEEVRSKASTS